MAAAKQLYRRRRLIVNRPLQFRFVGVMLLFFCVLTVVTLLGLYFALWLTLYTFNLLHDPVIVSLFTTTGMILAFELLLLGPLVIWMGLWLTHKVAGPLVRIRPALEQMEQGRFDTRLSLRKGDALVELADDVNRLAESLRSRAS